MSSSNDKTSPIAHVPTIIAFVTIHNDEKARTIPIERRRLFLIDKSIPQIVDAVIAPTASMDTYSHFNITTGSDVLKNGFDSTYACTTQTAIKQKYPDAHVCVLVQSREQVIANYALTP